MWDFSDHFATEASSSSCNLEFDDEKQLNQLRQKTGWVATLPGIEPGLPP